MRWALLLTSGFFVAEVVGGLVAGSLTLLADAVHMLADAAALALTWLGFRVSARPSDARRSYGYQRFQSDVMAAVVIVLIVLVQVIQSLGDRYVRRISHR